MSTMTTTPASQLRAEQDALQAERRTLAALVEVHASGGRIEARTAQAVEGPGGMLYPSGDPLTGITMYYDSEVVGLPGIGHVRDAAARLSQVDARLHEIAEAMPDAEEREHEHRERAQREAEQRRQEQAARQRDECKDAARAAAAADADYNDAHAALHALIAEGPLGELIRARGRRAQAALRVRATLPTSSDERVQAADALGAAGIAARRALATLPGLPDPAALPPAQDDSEFGWLIDALLNLPALANAVTDLNMREAQR